MMRSPVYPLPGSLPHFTVELRCPDLTPWLEGNTGVRGFTTLDSGKPGPHVALIALTHGNEITGAAALATLLARGLRPEVGRLTFGFANLAAFARFDPRRPTTSRFVDEDMNRLWDPMVLDGPRHSIELDRAREIRPLLADVDVLLDLHSMLWPSEPLILCGSAAKGRRLARGIAVPSLAIADRGHASGRRLIDYAPFVDPERACAANLLEAGQHWQASTVTMVLAAIAGLLHHAGVVHHHDAFPENGEGSSQQRFAEVIRTVTARSDKFSFVQPFRGGAIVPRCNTLVALDGEEEIRTPCADCMLVMPSLRPSRGHTAVRFARIVSP